MLIIFTYTKNSFLWLFKILIAPRATHWDAIRREFILNVLLVGLISLAFTAFIYKTLLFFNNPSSYEGLHPFVLLIFLVFICSLLLLSRTRKSAISAAWLVSFLFLSAAYTSIQWGVNVPQGLLIHALAIVMAGILISTKASFAVTAGSMTSLIIIFYLEQQGIIKPDFTWKHLQTNIGEVLVFGITLAIIAITSWLSNREISRALRRAKKSEAALRKQRDNLEIVVEKRTRELRKTQAEKLAQVYQFSEFGRFSSGIFHDLVNPLNLISLNLQKLSNNSKETKLPELSDVKITLERAMTGTRQLEKFIQAARKQLQQQEVLKRFSIQEEISETMRILDYRAKASQIQMNFILERDISLFGNPIKFDQAILNILSNAIDAYDKSRKKTKIITITLEKNDNYVLIHIQDFGMGIPEETLPRIFEPLFTTKRFDKGTGIGLSICKHIVENEFKGTILVQSRSKHGTIFTLKLPIIQPQIRKIIKNQG